MKFEGEVWFKAKEITRNENNSIEITIGNSGPLIPSEDLAKVFEPFFTKGKREGTGLGLVIAKRVVESHGGNIKCLSTQNIGTEFIFNLPKADSPLHSENSFSKWIVIIEDDIYMRKFWQKKLGEPNAKIFSSPSEFLIHVRENPSFMENIDCVVTDFYFENDQMTGTELARVIRSQSSDCILFLSSSSQETHFDHAELELFDTVLEKRVYARHELSQIRTKAS
jgi:hypothetical protein